MPLTQLTSGPIFGFWPVLLKNRLLKKSVVGGGECDTFRYRAAEKLEIIRLVEQSPLPVRRKLEQLGIFRATFYAGIRCIRHAAR